MPDDTEISVSVNGQEKQVLCYLMSLCGWYAWSISNWKYHSVTLTYGYSGEHEAGNLDKINNQSVMEERNPQTCDSVGQK